MSVKEDYQDFAKWYKRKEKEPLFVVTMDNELAAVLYLKIEVDEYDERIAPTMKRNKKMKIRTFKVGKEGLGIGNVLMNFIFIKAQEKRVDELYLTVHNRHEQHRKFISYIKKYGFALYGYKQREGVYVKRLLNA